MKLASGSQRFLNLIIDGVTFIILLSVIKKGIALYALGSGKEWLYDVYNSQVLAINVYLIYCLSEVASGRTIAKFITGTKAVCEDGTKLTLKKTLARAFCRLIPFEAFSFLGGEANNCVGWHDKFSKTRVVRTR